MLEYMFSDIAVPFNLISAELLQNVEKSFSVHITMDNNTQIRNGKTMWDDGAPLPLSSNLSLFVNSILDKFSVMKNININYF